jgi:hypothetical protein
MRKARSFERRRDNWIDVTYKRAVASAAKRGIPFDLHPSDMELLAARAHGHCEVSGIPFSFADHPPALKRPWVPSLDRIDSSMGYTFDNLRLVCTAVNFSLHQWGDDVLETVCRAMAVKLGIASNSGLEEGYITERDLADRWGTETRTVRRRIRKLKMTIHYDSFGLPRFLVSDIRKIEDANRGVKHWNRRANGLRRVSYASSYRAPGRGRPALPPQSEDSDQSPCSEG